MRHMLMIFCIYRSISSKLSDYLCFIFLPLKWIKCLLIILLWIGFLGLCSNRCNLGYAFVNFTTTGAALRLYKLLHKLKWEAFCSKKVCEITYARLQVQHLISFYFGVYNICLNIYVNDLDEQGKESLVEHFKVSIFPCDSDDYLPVVFSPPRDGSASCPEPKTIGMRKY